MKTEGQPHISPVQSTEPVAFCLVSVGNKYRLDAWKKEFNDGRNRAEQWVG